MTNQENDLQDNDPSTQQQQSQEPNCTQNQQSHEEKEEEEEVEENPHLHQHQHPMISSPPPNPPSPPLDSPPESTDHSFDHTSSGYVFSAPEVKQATYQSPPSDYVHTSHTYVLSSPDKPSSPPPAPAPPPPSAPPAGDGISGAGINRRPRTSISISERNREVVKRKCLLGFRIWGFLFCLISFSIMGSDKNKGWAMDSFYRYKEFRYFMSVNVIGFAYLGVQSCDLAYCLATGKIIARNPLRFLLDFSLDQILTYLVLSASSSAAFRVEDWESNWGKDKFPAMARSSVVLSFLAFVAFTLSSLISGHTLFTSKLI